MSTVDEQLATAMLAKLAGSTLYDIDKNTVSQSSSGPAAKIDPKKFLPGIQQIQQQQQNRIVESSQKIAEQLYPLPSDQSTLKPTSISVVDPTMTEDPNQLTFDFLDETTTKKTFKQLDLVVDYLYSINNKLDKIISCVSKNNNK
jgi:hypothetical protein